MVVALGRPPGVDILEARRGWCEAQRVRGRAGSACPRDGGVHGSVVVPVRSLTSPRRPSYVHRPGPTQTIGHGFWHVLSCGSPGEGVVMLIWPLI